MILKEIRETLKNMQDEGYRAFQKGLIPGMSEETMIGVRTPQLRAYAKQLARRKDIDEFLKDLPHMYFEENQLHAFLIGSCRDFHTCMQELERFLPYVDNWATCDQMSPIIFKKHREELVPYINRWLGSDHVFTVRFGIKVLMDHFLEEEFEQCWPNAVSHVQSDAYYVEMMQAWYFATALAKQYDAVLPYIQERRLKPSVHARTIRKALESFRIPEEHKAVLRTLR
ncbi:MAG: DNA alkylation repair protein [Solobacterium sp.]|nr:DNA alkylation repair protein [Solobacterium sp.]